MKPQNALAARRRHGFVFGELLVALLLLAVAVSSVAALMYSVSRRPAAGRAETECLTADAARGKCVPTRTETGPGPASSTLLRSGCETRSVFDQRKCKDTVISSEEVKGETVVKPRTDSAAMALLAKKQKAQAAAVRTDRGFVR